MKKLAKCLALTAAAATVMSSAAMAEGVYYLNFKPEANDAWQALAAAYTEETGVPVTVVTAASGRQRWQRATLRLCSR